MSKVIQAANAMISRRDLIGNVLMDGGEVFFKYNGKYVWSIRNEMDEYYLYFYPTAKEVEFLLEEAANVGWRDVPMMVYTASEIGTKEAKDTFAELYTTVKERVYGVDDVLQDIIDSDPF